MTQNQMILAHLKTGAELTPIEALNKFGSFRLASRIHELKEKGWPVVCDRRDVGEGRYVGHYSLVNDKDLWPDV